MAHRFTIMTVDDDPNILFLLSKILKKEGFEVISYNNPVEALEALETQKIDLIISDIMMPKMSGIQFCALAKEKYKSIYFILLTAKNTTEDIVEGLETGADDYITKPFSNIEVFARVNAGKRFVEFYNQSLLFDEKLELINSKIKQINNLAKDMPVCKTEACKKAFSEIKKLASEI